MYHHAKQTPVSVTIKGYGVAGIALFLHQSLSPQHFWQLTHVLAKAAILSSPPSNPIINSD